jgi:hypothetical protein
MNTEKISNEAHSNSINPMLPAGAVNKIKLSKAQKQLIQKMRDSNILHYMQGLNARCFFARSNRSESWATIHKLEMLNLIERGDRFVELTELGRNVEL